MQGVQASHSLLTVLLDGPNREHIQASVSLTPNELESEINNRQRWNKHWLLAKYFAHNSLQAIPIALIWGFLRTLGSNVIGNRPTLGSRSNIIKNLYLPIGGSVFGSILLLLCYTIDRFYILPKIESEFAMKFRCLANFYCVCLSQCIFPYSLFPTALLLFQEEDEDNLWNKIVTIESKKDE